MDSTKPTEAGGTWHYKKEKIMDEKKVARELVVLARELVAAKIKKGDVVVVDIDKAKKDMPEDEWAALRVIALRSNFIFNVESKSSRDGKWYITQKGGRGGFVNEDALTPTGNTDPDRFAKDVEVLTRILATGSRMVVKVRPGGLNLRYLETISAPPLTTSDVGRISKRVEKTVKDFIKEVSDLLDVVKSDVNPYILMSAKSGEIVFYSEFSVYTKPTKTNQKKLEIIADAIS